MLIKHYILFKSNNIYTKISLLNTFKYLQGITFGEDKDDDDDERIGKKMEFSENYLRLDFGLYDLRRKQDCN